MVKTGAPEDRSDQISGPEIVTLVNEVLASTEKPIGSFALLSARGQPQKPAAEKQTTASSDRNEPVAPAVTGLEIAVVVIGFVGVTLTAILFFLSP